MHHSENIYKYNNAQDLLSDGLISGRALSMLIETLALLTLGNAVPAMVAPRCGMVRVVGFFFARRPPGRIGGM